jgi:hypothetical protein
VGTWKVRLHAALSPTATEGRRWKGRPIALKLVVSGPTAAAAVGGKRDRRGLSRWALTGGNALVGLPGKLLGSARTRVRLRWLSTQGFKPIVVDFPDRTVLFDSAE